MTLLSRSIFLFLTVTVGGFTGWCIGYGAGWTLALASPELTEYLPAFGHAGAIYVVVGMLYDQWRRQAGGEIEQQREYIAALERALEADNKALAWVQERGLGVLGTTLAHSATLYVQELEAELARREGPR